MKKNVSIVNGLLLLPLIASSFLSSMELATTNDKKIKQEKNETHFLAESTINPIIPTESGLGAWDYIYDSFKGQANSTMSQLKDQSLNFKNTSNHHKVDKTIIYFAKTQPNSDQLALMMTYLREKPYKSNFKLNELSCARAHDFLAKENALKQSLLKETITKNDQKFITEHNALIDKLQTLVCNEMEILKTKFETYIKERNQLVSTEGNKIRTLKKALINVHKKNDLFKATPNEEYDGYCSDEEKNPNNVEQSYDDDYILKKNNLNFSMSQTETNTKKTIELFYAFSTNILDIKPVIYKDKL